VLGISESSVSINWETNNDEYTSASITLYPDADPPASPRSFKVENSIEKSIKIEGLKGLTRYSYELSLLNSDEVKVAEEGFFITNFSSLKTALHTRDSLTLRGEIFYLASWESKVPVIIMMHGLDEVMNTWKESETMMKLLKQGFACLVFYNRGHTPSDPFDTEIFPGPEGVKYLGADVEAAIKGLRQFEFVDALKVGLMGGSMGGSSSVIGNYFPEVIASVPLGPEEGEGGNNMKEFFPELEEFQLKGVFYIAAEHDIPVRDGVVNDIPEFCLDLFGQTQPPRKIWIIKGESAHGSKLAALPGVQDTLVAWFVEQMPSPYSH